MTFAHWNVRTLLDREATDRPERRPTLVAMELDKYNIDIAVSDMIMAMTKDRNTTIVSAYDPTMVNPAENKEACYSRLKGTFRNISSTDTLLLIGVFNERIEGENDK